MEDERAGSSRSQIRHISDHPVARHRAANPVVLVSMENAAETAHQQLVGHDLELFEVRSGEDYRNARIYGGMPVPPEELWCAVFVRQGCLDGGSPIVGISKWTGEAVFQAVIQDGG